MGADDMPRTLILTAKDVRGLLRMAEVMSAVEDAFRAYGEGGLEMPPKAYWKAAEGDFRAMPARIAGAAGVLRRRSRCDGIAESYQSLDFQESSGCPLLGEPTDLRPCDKSEALNRSPVCAARRVSNL